MTNKKNTTTAPATNNQLHTDFTQSEMKRFALLNGVIANAQKTEHAASLRIAGALLEIRTKELYKITNTDFGDFCVEKHGMSRGNATDAVNTFARFKKPDKYELEDKWAGVGFTKLRNIKSLTDEEIEKTHVLDCKTAEAMKELVKLYGQVKKELPPDWTVEDFKSAIHSKRQAEDTKAIESKVDEIEKDIAAHEAKKAGFTPAEESETPFNDNSVPKAKESEEAVVSEDGGLMQIHTERLDITALTELVTVCLKNHLHRINNGELVIKIML